MTTIPQALIDAHKQWVNAGKRPQGAFRWRPEAWERRFSRRGGLIISGVDAAEAVRTISIAAKTRFNGNDELIDRDLVRSLHAPDLLRPGGSDDTRAVVTAFIAAMIWGYGATGYGPYRTERVLTADPEAVRHLCEIARIAQDPSREQLDAFSAVADKKRHGELKYLGPAFGTKFLYFLTSAADGVRSTPVMDAVVRRWFSIEAGVALTTSWWDSTSYATFLEALDDWGAALAEEADGDALARDTVELLIFASARGDAWSWVPGTEVAAIEDSTVDQLLDVLQGDIAELSERSGSTRGPELLAQLADWVAGVGREGEQLVR
ncbi:hypothetical protein M4D54_01965 [Brachybacterium sp. p3-SID1565]|uniref:Uncharacterized protein n=1 Tax=Brachybacterium epidermidis TaxID=2781983 RepID=A0ABR9W1F1_9MICO|nr:MULTISPECIES: hypothetical protein [Brachybacterium]MBE9404269.1 hypothetical protein [Brachybacterium epidermidis]MCT1384407.1 hypothetical protein [Brachybacterium sp. p3-SID1565]